MRFVLAMVFSLIFAQPALAKWREASSDHFVIYAEDSEKDLLRFSEYLERYHSALELLTGRDLPKPSPSNRVTIFVVGSARDVKVLHGNRNSAVAGFYIPRAGGTVAFVQKLRGGGSSGDWSLIVLLHEYAHHFMISQSSYAMPRWVSEGGAEFFASASFTRDGEMMIGMPANHRAGELLYAVDVPIRALLDDDLYRENRGKRYDAFYGRSWLLYHYLTFEPTRQGQLGAYLKSLADGAAPLDAAEQVFGDIDKLEKELDRYLRQRRMKTFQLPAHMTKVGPVSVRDLSPGMEEMMSVIIQSKRGVDEEEALEILVEARQVAERYPQDPGVLAALAEAEFDAGYYAAAIEVADRAIAIDPSRKNAYVQKGYALFRQAGFTEDRDAAYAAAMIPFQTLNRLENKHPIPLIYFYRSFEKRGAEPPELARQALEQAAMMAPFDKDLWMNMVVMLAGEGKIALAAQMIQPVISDPHGGGRARQAAFMLEQLERAPEGEPFVPDWSKFVATEADGEAGEE